MVEEDLITWSAEIPQIILTLDSNCKNWIFVNMSGK